LGPRGRFCGGTMIQGQGDYGARHVVVDLLPEDLGLALYLCVVFRIPRNRMQALGAEKGECDA